MSTIQIRIDSKLKKSAKKILDSIGLDMSSAIKIYLKKLTERKGLPFLVTTENGLTIQEEEEILKAVADAKKGKNISKTMSGEEFLDELRSL